MTSQNNPLEFRRSDQLTLQMQPTEELRAFFVEWAASVPTLYFLDICVVGATKLAQALLEKNLRKAQIIGYLRSLDRPQHAFSYLFALMEKVSDSRGVASDAELEEQVRGDLAALRAFFKKAKVHEPDELVIPFLRDLRRTPIELLRPCYLSFLEQVNNQLELRNTISPALRLQKAKEILAVAHSLEINQQHPVVILVLSCLYGNTAAKKLMKFKEDPGKFNAENVLADIMAITRFAQFKLQIEHWGREGGKYLRSEFITDDDGLIGVIDCFQPDVVKLEETRDACATRYTFTVKLKKLLTEIGADEYEQLLDELIASQSGGSKV
ncbi:MAG: hypothetical protein FDZ72_04795 [Betaproteobacteria bacterium]|nr:MAG: hypothetical protein FDZ72_04795 [Betaproteobacteria bacterium]